MWESDHIQIRFELGRHGWSTLLIGTNAEPHQIQITHIFDDPVEELIRFAESLNNKNYPARAVFRDEPGTHLIEVRPHENSLPILTLSQSNRYSVENGSKMQRIATFPVVPRFVSTQIVADLKRIAHLLGDKEFQKNRSSFPWQAYRRLVKE